EEARTMNAYEFAAGFKGMTRKSVDGSDFEASYHVMESAIDFVRKERKPILVHAKVPLLGHHTSGVRKEWYRGEADLKKHAKDDPGPKLKKTLIKKGVQSAELKKIEQEATEFVAGEFEKAVAAPEPDPKQVDTHVFTPTPIIEEKGD